MKISHQLKIRQLHILTSSAYNANTIYRHTALLYSIKIPSLYSRHKTYTVTSRIHWDINWIFQAWTGFLEKKKKQVLVEDNHNNKHLHSSHNLFCSMVPVYRHWLANSRSIIHLIDLYKQTVSISMASPCMVFSWCNPAPVSFVSKFLGKIKIWSGVKVIFGLKTRSNIKKHKLDTIQFTIFISKGPVIVCSQNCIIAN